MPILKGIGASSWEDNLASGAKGDIVIAAIDSDWRRVGSEVTAHPGRIARQNAGGMQFRCAIQHGSSTAITGGNQPGVVPGDSRTANALVVRRVLAGHLAHVRAGRNTASAKVATRRRAIA